MAQQMSMALARANALPSLNNFSWVLLFFTPKTSLSRIMSSLLLPNSQSFAINLSSVTYYSTFSFPWSRLWKVNLVTIGFEMGSTWALNLSRQMLLLFVSSAVSTHVLKIRVELAFQN